MGAPRGAPSGWGVPEEAGDDGGVRALAMRGASAVSPGFAACGTVSHSREKKRNPQAPKRNIAAVGRRGFSWARTPPPQGGGSSAGSRTGWPPKPQPCPPPLSLSFPPCGLSTGRSPRRGVESRFCSPPAQGRLREPPHLPSAGSDPEFGSLSFSLFFFLMSQPLICHIKPPHYQLSKFCSDNSDRGSCDSIATARGDGELAGGYFMPCREPEGWATEPDNGLSFPFI